MTIHLPLPLTLTAKVSTENSPPIKRLRDYLHEQGRSLIVCLVFVAREVGATAGYLLIDEARRATAWTWAIDHRVERVRALLMLEHLDNDDDAIPSPDLFGDLDSEAVHACCRNADLLADLLHAAAQDGLARAETRPIPLRPAMRPALPPRTAPAPRSGDAAAATAVSVSQSPKTQRAV